jgi:hypothetical protein
MDIGMILIQVKDGTAQVVRCEEDGASTRLVPAANAAELADWAARVVASFGATLDLDGRYLCTDDFQAAAQFSPLALPDDAISLGEAGRLLAPNASQQERWERLQRLQKARALRVYRVGIAFESRQYVSRAVAVQLAAQ